MALGYTLRRLACHPTLFSLTLDQISTFIRLASVLKRDIQQPQPITHTNQSAPLVLPPSISQFLTDATGIPADSMGDCWDILKDEVWLSQVLPVSEHDEELFRVHRWKWGMSEPFIH
jgi:hypothetical protein